MSTTESRWPAFVGEQISLLPDLTPAVQVVTATPGRVRRSDPVTSKHAALKYGLKPDGLKHRILLHLSQAGARGANDWELHVHCDLKGRVHSAATRRGELEKLELVRRTAVMRPTDDPTSEGLVSVLTEAGAAALVDIARKVRAAQLREVRDVA